MVIFCAEGGTQHPFKKYPPEWNEQAVDIIFT